MLLDGGVVFMVIIIVMVLAFIKGYTYEKGKSNPMDKYSDKDIQFIDDFVKNWKNSKK